MKRRSKINAIFYSLRPGQWVKNLAVFAAIIFNGQFFNGELFYRSLLTFGIFCLLSSGSYIFNDIIDAPYDRKHPKKKYRPIARGDLSTSLAIKVSILLLLTGIGIAAYGGLGVFLISFLFIALHFSYSLLLKRFPLWDILGISLSFILRTLGGVVATGYYLPIWLMFTVIFLSLFIASGKRRSELVREGTKTRPTLEKYHKGLINFYTSVFAVSTFISYSLFSYFAGSQEFGGSLVKIFGSSLGFLVLGRKWLMITIFPVIFGIMRYAQLVFNLHEGEKPEKLISSDIPLATSVLVWGLMVILVIYVI